MNAPIDSYDTGKHLFQLYASKPQGPGNGPPRMNIHILKRIIQDSFEWVTLFHIYDYERDEWKRICDEWERNV